MILYRRYSRKGWHLQQGDKESRWVGGDKDGTWLYNPIIQGQTKENYPLVIRYGKGNPQLIHGFPLREKPFLEDAQLPYVWAVFDSQRVSRGPDRRVFFIHQDTQSAPRLLAHGPDWDDVIFARYDNCVLTISNYLMAFSDMPPTGSLGSLRPGSRCGEGECVDRSSLPTTHTVKIIHLYGLDLYVYIFI